LGEAGLSISSDTQKSLLRAIARLEYRLAETEFEARACRTAIAELRAGETADGTASGAHDN